MPEPLHFLSYCLLLLALAGTASSTAFLVLALMGARKFLVDARRQRSQAASIPADSLPPASILKPLHGLEPNLEQNLESFFRQDYPKFEIVLAVDEMDDAALPVARRVCARHPNIPSRILVTGNSPWLNPPTYSFARMSEAAKYDYLVTSDSDVHVGRDYLQATVTPLLEENTGMLTCVYRGSPTGGLWSLIDSIGMSVEMTAGVLTANLLEGIKFGLGPTIAVRRDALDAVGGYAAFHDYAANDFILGNAISAKGYLVVLSRYVVAHVAPALTFRGMWRRHLRWAISTKLSRPKGHLGTGLIFALPYGLIGALAGWMTGWTALGLALLGWALLNRMVEALVIGYGVAQDPDCLSKAWLYPIRDLLGACVWAGSYMRRSFPWRSSNFEVGEGGRFRERVSKSAA